jgi:hypothetical protein
MDSVNNVAATCLGSLLKDEPWQDLGFAKRPRHGKFFERFRPKWKNELENKAVQEILATFTAAYALASRITSEDIPSVIALYTAKADLVTALGYSSRDEAARHLSERIAQYCRTPTADWHALIVKQIDPSSIPNKKLSANILVGCIRFTRNAGMMIHALEKPPKKQKSGLTTG